MNQRKLGAAFAAFAALIILKLAAPGIGAHAREQLAETLSPGDETLAFVRELGSRLSIQKAAPAPFPEEQDGADAEERGVILFPVPTPLPLPDKEQAGGMLPAELPEASEEPAETPLPAAVEAFLETQAAFSEYALPETVDYAYEALPFPYAVPVEGRNSSGFGYRLHPILNTVRFHYGTDFAAFSGERISAFADGTVSFAGYDDSYGYHVRIDHGDGWETHYAHCSAIYVSAGQRVQKGESIALVGASGLATGPHLHFELVHNGMYLNPEYYING